MLSATLLPVALGDETYRTDAIRGGLSFSGADGLQLVELRPGLVVLDDISADGDVRGRVSVFAADPTVVEGVVSAAVEDGYLQATGALFTGSGEALSRQDLTVTGDGLADLACVSQSACIPLGDDEELFDPSVWARSENFLVEASPGAPAIFVLVQTKGFGDPLLSQSFEIIDSLRLG